MKSTYFYLLAKIVCVIFSSYLIISCATPEQVEQSQNLPTESEITTTETTESMPSPESQVASVGRYLSLEDFQASSGQFAESKVVYFFNAAWCSTCKVARDNFEATLDEIPADLTVVVVDFDNSSELRKKYGVTIQHTYVQIDSQGELVNKWSGSTSFDQIFEQTL